GRRIAYEHGCATCTRARSRSAVDTEGVRLVGGEGAPSESGAHTRGASRSGVGPGLAGTARVSSCLHGPAAEKARAGSIESALSRHRTVGGLPIQPARLKASEVSNPSAALGFVHLPTKLMLRIDARPAATVDCIS